MFMYSLTPQNQFVCVTAAQRLLNRLQQGEPQEHTVPVKMACDHQQPHPHRLSFSQYSAAYLDAFAQT